MTTWPEAGSSAAQISLRELIERRGALTPQAALLILRESLAALAAGYDRGAVHQAYRPEVVLVDSDGCSELADFDGQRQAGAAPYLAPEQRDGGPAGTAASIYAATAVFFECLTGLAPSYERIRQFRGQQLAVSAAIGEASEPLRGLMSRGMAPNPADRPASAGAFIAELDDLARAVYGQGWARQGRHDLKARVADTLAPGIRISRKSGSGALTVWIAGRRRALAAAMTAAAAVVVIAAGGTAFALTGHFGLASGRSAAASRQGPSASAGSGAPGLPATDTAADASPGVNPALTADATVSPSATTSACTSPVSFSASASISAMTASAVSYQWVYSSGATGPVQTLTFAKAGRKRVTAPAIKTKTAGSGWAAVKFLAPRQALSNKASYILDCSTGPVTVSASASVTPQAATLSCAAAPPALTFTGTITNAKAGTVSYYWELPDGNGPTRTLSFGSAGTQPVSPAKVTASSGSATESGTLIILTPVAVSSNTATATVTCTAPAASPPVNSSPLPSSSPEPPAPASPGSSSSTLTISGWNLPVGTTLQPYAGSFTATGGKGPYTWTLNGQPAGLIINPSTGAVTGTATDQFGAWNVEATVTDSENPPRTASVNTVLVMNLSQLKVTPVSIPNTATAGVSYQASFTVSGGDPGSSYTWSASGLPAGLSLQADGNKASVTGKPTEGGSRPQSLEVTVVDGPRQGAYGWSVAVSPSSIKVATASLPGGTVGTAYTATLTASGGNGDYLWYANGRPPGLALNQTTGEIFGTPTAAGTYAVEVSVHDSAYNDPVGAATLYITIKAASS